jgi:hypothetical protein
VVASKGVAVSFMGKEDVRGKKEMDELYFDRAINNTN